MSYTHNIATDAILSALKELRLGTGRQDTVDDVISLYTSACTLASNHLTTLEKDDLYNVQRICDLMNEFEAHVQAYITANITLDDATTWLKRIRAAFQSPDNESVQLVGTLTCPMLIYVSCLVSAMQTKYKAGDLEDVDLLKECIDLFETIAALQTLQQKFRHRWLCEDFSDCTTLAFNADGTLSKLMFNTHEVDMPPDEIRKRMELEMTMVNNLEIVTDVDELPPSLRALIKNAPDNFVITVGKDKPNDNQLPPT